MLFTYCGITLQEIIVNCIFIYTCYTEILLDLTLVFIHSDHRDLDILSHGTLLSHVHVSPLHRYYYTWYHLCLLYASLIHGYTSYHHSLDTLYTVMSCIYTTVTYIHRYTCIDCYILVVWITVLITWTITTCIFLSSYYMIVSRYLYWYSHYWTCELLICDVWNPTSIVSLFLLSCFMLSIELISCYHVTCTMHCTCSCYAVYCKHNKDNLGMGKTWRLIRSYQVDVLDPHC